MWNNSWGGTYRLNDATVEVVVHFATGSIQLARLESQGQDWLDILGSNAAGIENREDLISYLWPGNDEFSWRYHPMPMTLMGDSRLEIKPYLEAVVIVCGKGSMGSGLVILLRIYSGLLRWTERLELSILPQI